VFVLDIKTLTSTSSGCMGVNVLKILRGSSPFVVTFLSPPSPRDCVAGVQRIEQVKYLGCLDSGVDLW